MRAYLICDGALVERMTADVASLADALHPDILALCRDFPADTPLGSVWTGTDLLPPPVRIHTITADDVRAEASRRMQVLVGARNADHLDIIITNGTREAVRLLRKSPAEWTPEESQRAAELAALDEAIEAIRTASNAMETNPPADYASDTHWLPTSSGGSLDGSWAAILGRIDGTAPIVSLQERRIAALEVVAALVREIGAVRTVDQVRYELALQAINGSTAAVALLEPEAVARSLTVAGLSNQIVGERQLMESRMAALGAAEARAKIAIAAATSDTLDSVLATARADIEAARGI